VHQSRTISAASVDTVITTIDDGATASSSPAAFTAAVSDVNFF